MYVFKTFLVYNFLKFTLQNSEEIQIKFYKFEISRKKGGKRLRN